jgi:hypothetical protein
MATSVFPLHHEGHGAAHKRVGDRGADDALSLAEDAEQIVREHYYKESCDRRAATGGALGREPSASGKRCSTRCDNPAVADDVRS